MSGKERTPWHRKKQPDQGSAQATDQSHCASKQMRCGSISISVSTVLVFAAEMTAMAFAAPTAAEDEGMVGSLCCRPNVQTPKCNGHVQCRAEPHCGCICDSSYVGQYCEHYRPTVDGPPLTPNLLGAQSPPPPPPNPSCVAPGSQLVCSGLTGCTNGRCYCPFPYAGK